MPKNRSKDRSSLCSFTFADGRQCRTPRRSGHPHLCFFHARKEAQAQAAEETGRDVSSILSGSYLSACDLSAALGRLFTAVAQGKVKPKTASTLAYLGQTLLNSIPLAQYEYINSFGTNCWRETIRSSFSEDSSPDSDSASDSNVGAQPLPDPASK
jgi:hypothetical protein